MQVSISPVNPPQTHQQHALYMYGEPVGPGQVASHERSAADSPKAGTCCLLKDVLHADHAAADCPHCPAKLTAATLRRHLQPVQIVELLNAVYCLAELSGAAE